MRLGIVLVCACVAMAIAAPAMPDAEKEEVPDIADIMMSLARDNNVDIEDLGKIIARDQPNSGSEPADEHMVDPSGMDDSTDSDLEADVLVTAQQKKEIEDADKQSVDKRGGATGARYRWPGNKIYYRYHSSITASVRNVIKSAMDDWERYTCARFINGRNSAGHYILIFRGGGCYSYLGYVRRAGQRLSIGNGCQYKGIVIHELAHAQGILHEQSRPDRDNYVTINTANIISRYLGNFRKHSTGTVSGTRYDFGSVMHYGDKAFAINRNIKTIIPKAPNQNAVLGQRRGLSQIDIQHANKFLSCSSNPAPGPATTPAPGPATTPAPGPGPAPGNDLWPATYCRYIVSAGGCAKPEYNRYCVKSCKSKRYNTWPNLACIVLRMKGGCSSNVVKSMCSATCPQ